MKKKKVDIKEKLSKVLEIPEEVMLDVPKVTMISNRNLLIENYKGIIEYSQQQIRVNTSVSVIKIEGKDLEIKGITAEDLVIDGEIVQVRFL